MIRRLISTAACALLAACGGGADPTQPEQAPASAGTTIAAPAPHALAEVFGDSTFVRCYPDQIGDAVNYAENALGRQIINAAVGGSMSTSVTPQRIAASSADVVAMNWAINDSAGLTIAEYRAQITAQASAAIAAGKSVVLVESTPIITGGSLSDRRSDAARLEYEAIKREVARATGSYYCALPARSWTLADKPDGVHEADAAAEWKGRVLAECIRRAL